MFDLLIVQAFLKIKMCSLELAKERAAENRTFLHKLGTEISQTKNCVLMYFTETDQR
jgi:hypothetical protein